MQNTLITLSDNKIGTDTNADNKADFYTASVLSATDYYAFGMSMKERSWQSEKYRYGFNGKENDAEGGFQDYGMRVSKEKIGRFTSPDPIAKSFAWNSPYAFAENDVIRSIDLDGLEKIVVINSRVVTDLYQRDDRKLRWSGEEKAGLLNFYKSVPFLSQHINWLKDKRAKFNFGHPTNGDNYSFPNNKIVEVFQGPDKNNNDIHIYGLSDEQMSDKLVEEGWGTANFTMIDKISEKDCSSCYQIILTAPWGLSDGKDGLNRNKTTKEVNLDDNDFLPDVEKVNFNKWGDAFNKVKEWFGTGASEKSKNIFNNPKEIKEKHHIRPHGGVQHPDSISGKSTITHRDTSAARIKE